MDDLPPDTLVNIFTKYLEDDDDDDYFERPTYSPTASPWSSADPVLLGQVCRYWRSITFFNTFLWSRIYITDPQQSHIERTKLWLDRAGSHLLDLGIVYFMDPSDWDETATTDILRMFITRIPYWRKIKFQVPYSSIRDLAAITTSSQRCDHLEVACVDSMSPTFDGPLTPTDQAHLEAIWRTLHSSPRLYKVCWHGIFDTPPEHAPWRQIKSIELMHLNLPDFLHIFVSSPMLEFFAVSAIPDHFPISQPHTPAPITHDNLTHFEISGCRAGQQTIIATVLLPSLLSLEIYQDEDSNHQPEPFPTIHRFLCDSRCQLQRFHYADSAADGGHDLAKFLGCSAFETLQFLGLDLNSVGDEVLLVLYQQNPDGSHHLMPRLEEIELCEWKSTDGLLSNMITSRFNAFLKLARLRRSLDGSPPFDQVQLEGTFPGHSQSGKYIQWVSRGRAGSEP